MCDIERIVAANSKQPPGGEIRKQGKATSFERIPTFKPLVFFDERHSNKYFSENKSVGVSQSVLASLLLAFR